MKPSRLDLYNKYIVNFDFLDRNLSKVKKQNFENVSLKTNTYSIYSKTELLTLSLILEVLTQQRFLIKFIKNKNNYLQIYIQKKRVLSLLDIYLVSIFLNKLNKFNLSHDKAINKLYIFIPIQVINNLGLINICKGKIQIDLGIKTSFYKFY